MANVVIFTDNPPRNLTAGNLPFYLRYQTRPAGAYAVASYLRCNGFTVKVVNNCSSYTLAGIKQIIDNNAEDLLWVGLSTTFFTASSATLTQYRQQWSSTDNLFFNDGLEALIGKENMSGRADFRSSGRELIWGSNEVNQIADYCQLYSVPFLIGGAWVSNIHNGNLNNLRSNVHVIKGRAEETALHASQSLSNANQSNRIVTMSNTQFDDTTFKKSMVCWDQTDFIGSSEWLPVEISRGCAFNCAYCSYDRKSSFDSYRNLDVIREELISNYERFGVTKFIIMDDLYNESKEKVRCMYDQVWSKLPFTPEWASYMRLDMIWSDPESAEILKASGARMGSFGIETLHDVAGKRVGKGLGKQRILDTLEHLKQVWKDDVLIHSYFIAGLPNEPEESILETINWTTSTKLLDTVTYTPLWVTPPSHKEFVLITNAMSNDTEKYNLRWADDNTWINDQGITFSRASELAALGNKSRALYIGGYSEYVEYRQLGLTHQQIVDFMGRAHSPNNTVACIEYVNELEKTAIANIKSRIEQTLDS